MRGSCGDCGKPDRLLDQEGRCRWCRERVTKSCADCGRINTALTGVDQLRVCDRCALRRQLDRVLPPDSTGVLHPLRTAILLAQPLTTRRWLDRANQLLTDVHFGRIALDHAALDTLPQRKAVEHLRALMISCEILPPDEGRELRWLENDLPAMLADLDGAHSQAVTAWLRWAVLPRLRRLLADGCELSTSVTNDRRKIEQVVAFLLVLQTEGTTLDHCGQQDLDTWFAGPGTIRGRLRPFLAWAQHRKHLPDDLTLPPSYKGTPVAPLDAEQRWTIARRLVEDDTLDPADRVAGALVVLYAQPLARIITLTTADLTVTDGQVQLRLGPDALDLPEPFATLIRLLPRRRRESSAQQVPNPWLFAGTHAGRHINAVALAARLGAIGIEPRRARLAAVDQLSREIPPAMLAGVLGLTPRTASNATTRTGGQWANYAADRQSRLPDRSGKL
jgi:hypothetical protein